MVREHPLSGRAAGVLLHVTSLPNGVLDHEAERFIDWLAAAGQSWWQILPLSPPDAFGSPYAGLSAFACRTDLVPHDGRPVPAGELAAYRTRNTGWIDHWERFAGPGAVEDQVRFERRWREVRDHARRRGVRILGDLPLYVAAGSVDVASHPEIFRTDAVAGVPPDYFSEDGQLWGNPLYDWDRLRAEGFAWWIARVRRSLELHDAVRLDHFRGLEAHWAVPADATTARDGAWIPTPGREMLDAVEGTLGHDIPIVAEDLGIITDQVEELRRHFRLPGMMVLQFEMDDHPAQDGRLWHEEDRVAYPGTHDNATVEEWWASVDDRLRWHVTESAHRCGIADGPPHRTMVELAHHAPARIAIASAQDILGLGASARMNTPGTTEGNWTWRLEAGALTDDLARWLRDLTEATGRSVPVPPRASA